MEENLKINGCTFDENAGRLHTVQDSLFKCLDTKIVPDSSVGNFSLEESKAVLQSPVGDEPSTDTSKKHLDTFKQNNQDILFSGYFGPRTENDKTPSAPTNPFIEEERRNLTRTPKGFNGFNGGFNTGLNISRQSNLSSKSSSNLFSFENLVKSVSIDKSKKIKSSEELLLEKIEKEKEELKKLKLQNQLTAEKNKHYQPKPITPTPLTLLKPFNFSSSKLLTKKRTGDYMDNEKINTKIKDTIRKKIESCGAGIKETVFINDKINYNKSPSTVKFMKKSIGSRSKSKSPCRDEDMASLSSRIEKYCVITNKSMSKKDKSPVKLSFTEEERFNQNAKNILNTSSDLHQLSTMSSSIRKQFASELSTEDKIAREMESYKFKAKPLNRNIFKKQPVVESFDTILMKTRQEKQELDMKLKENKKTQKINQIKQTQARKSFNAYTRDENCNTLNRNDLMLLE